MLKTYNLNRLIFVLVYFAFLLIFLYATVINLPAQQQSMISRTGSGTLTPVSDPYIRNNFPYRAVAKIFVTFPNCADAAEGTGVFVSADGVFTAAHNVYKPECGGYATRVDIIPGYSRGNEPFGRTSAKKIKIPNEYTSIADPRNDLHAANYDFAAIVTTSAIGHKSGWLGYNIPSGNNLGQIMILGYPEKYEGEIMAQSVSDAELAYSNGLGYFADTLKGMSGGPIIKIMADESFRVIGIHVRGRQGLPFNFGSRFSDDFLRGLPGCSCN
ncbi:MAG: trypsin-like peptidase domain-containing protein [Pyrinomonadaceae bacterium]